jgi:hypothetical protein
LLLLAASSIPNSQLLLLLSIIRTDHTLLHAVYCHVLIAALGGVHVARSCLVLGQQQLAQQCTQHAAVSAIAAAPSPQRQCLTNSAPAAAAQQQQQQQSTATCTAPAEANELAA